MRTFQLLRAGKRVREMCALNCAHSWNTRQGRIDWTQASLINWTLLLGQPWNICCPHQHCLGAMFIDYPERFPSSVWALLDYPNQKEYSITIINIINLSISLFIWRNDCAYNLHLINQACPIRFALDSCDWVWCSKLLNGIELVRNLFGGSGRHRPSFDKPFFRLSSRLLFIRSAMPTPKSN